MKTDAYFMDEAIKEAEKSLAEGGIPIGAVLVKDGQIISRGHNRLIQNDSVLLQLYTTLSPCPMCSGAVILYNIPRVVIGENTTLMGAEGLLECNCVEVVVLNDMRCRDLFLRFACNNPGVWEDELAKVGNTTEVKDGNNSD